MFVEQAILKPSWDPIVNASLGYGSEVWGKA
jgi:hypothetical protein